VAGRRGLDGPGQLAAGMAAAARAHRRDECEVERRRAIGFRPRGDKVGQVLHLELVRAALAVLKREARLRLAVTVDEGEAVARVVQDTAALRHQLAQPPRRAEVARDMHVLPGLAQRVQHRVPLVLEVELVNSLRVASYHEWRRLKQRNLHRGRQLAVGAAVAVVQSLLHRFHACAVGAMAAVVGAMAAFAQQVALLADGRRAHTPSAGSGQC
jgi:hypothetical protein